MIHKDPWLVIVVIYMCLFERRDLGNYIES